MLSEVFEGNAIVLLGAMFAALVALAFLHSLTLQPTVELAPIKRTPL
ncbi:MAG: hypothetical protein WED11_13125 [Natronospirillum sp.]